VALSALFSLNRLSGSCAAFGIGAIGSRSRFFKVPQAATLSAATGFTVFDDVLFADGFQP